MMVRGDGSLTSADSAVAVPVTTVLSGPAASVIGACALSGRRDGVVADMGGTTTDIAVVRDGRPELFALRAAPVQVGYLGYPGTMGAGWYDGLVTDAICSPPG